MVKTRQGKELERITLRVDEDVRAAINALKTTHPTINAGLRAKLIPEPGSWSGLSPKQIEKSMEKVIKKTPTPSQEFKGPLQKPKDRRK